MRAATTMKFIRSEQPKTISRVSHYPALWIVKSNVSSFKSGEKFSLSICWTSFRDSIPREFSGIQRNQKFLSNLRGVEYSL